MFNSPSNIDKKLLSLVIPVYNEMNLPYLSRLMNILINQSISPSEFQVIFVDNNSSDNFDVFFKDFVNLHEVSNFIYLHQPQKGVTNARKMGYDYVLTRYTKNHLIVSLDADSVITNEYCEFYYNKHNECRKNGNIEFYVGGTPLYDYNQIPDSLPKMKELLEYKVLLDEYLYNQTNVWKFEGGDSAISVELYNKVQLKPLYYIENKMIYPTPSDDWNYQFDVMYNHNIRPLKWDTSSVSKINCRKFIHNIQDMLAGDIYGENWEQLNNSVDEPIIDLTDEEYVELKYMLIRSSLVHHFFIKEYIKGRKFISKYNQVFKKFGHSEYDDIQNYFGPAIYCYLMYGKKLWEDIPASIIDLPWLELDIVTTLKEQILYDYDIVFEQVMFKLSKSNEIFKYFLEI